MDCVYCQPRWLFSHKNVSPETSYGLQNPWSTTGLNDWKHLSQRIRTHESSTHHAEACVIYEQWRNRGDNKRSVARVFAGKNKLLEKCFGKTSKCYVDVSKVRLTFCGSSEERLKDNKGNFLSIIQLLAKYNTILDKLLQLLPKGFPKYVSPLIQNELISVLAEEVLRD